MITQIRFRHGASTEWTTYNPILASGEPGYDSTLDRFKVGNGTDAWGDLPFQSYSLDELNAALTHMDEAVAAAEAAAEAAENAVGDAVGDPAGTAALLIAAHVVAVDPHGDRAYTDEQVSAVSDLLAARLLASSNLADLGSAATARTNLGLGTAATTAASAYDAAGAASTAQTAAATDATTKVATETTRATTAEGLKVAKASNLSDLASAATARTNLGLGTAAVAASTAFDVSGAAAAAQAVAVQRANHTGSQAISTITGLATEIQGMDAVLSYAGAVPLRNTRTSDTTRPVRWRGILQPPTTTGYAISGLDVWEQTL